MRKLNDVSSTILVIVMATISLLVVALPAFGQRADKWQIVVSKPLLEDEAIKVAIEDLGKTGKELSITFEVVSGDTDFLGNAIVVGDSTRNEVTSALLEQGRIKLEGVDNEQGYEIKTIKTDEDRTIIVAGGSVIGDVYGLYWILDRMRVFKEIPDIDVKRMPELKIRFVGGSSKEAMKNALRNCATWVSGGSTVNLVPWKSEPEKTENEKNRERTRELIKYAHSLHMKYFTVGDEFAYHPSLLKEFGATLSLADPAFWDAVQAKYRRLLQAMPELDGVRIRTGELTRVGGNYKAFNVMHDGEGCDWSLEKRYRTFVKKVYNVVVGEFDKIYFHRTWVTNDYEQHSKAQVYKKIFTEDVPVKNLYLSPYVNANDRWFFTAYNPTFNVTAHNMVILLSPMNYHASSGGKVFPTFPGQYFQAALQTIVASESNNLKGAHFGAADGSGWNTRNVTSYTANRLAWDCQENIRTIAKDFASIYFGRAAADKMADIYLLSPVAYKYGIYIEPATYGVFNTLSHLRLTTFQVKGYPRIDNGREHVGFLRKIYLQCKPWVAETLLYLDHGLDVANTMVEKYQTAKPLIEDVKLSQDVENSLQLTQLLIKTNNLYAKTFFSYFEYREDPTVENRSRLSELSFELKDTKKIFLAAPGCVYDLVGIEQLLKNVEQALADLPKAEKMLAKAPGPAEVKQIIAEQQQKYVKALKEHPEEAVKFLHWQGRVDGKDILKIKGRRLEVEHLQYDGIQDMNYSFLESLPNETVTVIPVDIESRSFRPFVLEQPSKKNNYTAKIYLCDYPMTGYSWWKFDLYYIPKAPEELGLKAPWEE